MRLVNWKLGARIDDVKDSCVGTDVERDLDGAGSVANDVAEQLTDDELGLVDELVAGSNAAKKFDKLGTRVDRRTRVFGSEHPGVHQSLSGGMKDGRSERKCDSG
jgi:hypothetical protein